MRRRNKWEDEDYSERPPSRGSGLSCLTGVLLAVLGLPLLACGGCVAIGFFGAAAAPEPNANFVPVNNQQPANQQANKNPAPVAQPEKPAFDSPSVGDKIVISTEMLLGVDENAFSEAGKLLRAKDEIGLTLMEQQERIFIVKAGTDGLLIEGGLFTSSVRILSGPHIGKSGYIASDFVKKKK